MAKKPVKLTKSVEQKLAGELPKNKILTKIDTTYAYSYMSRYHEYTDAIEFLSLYLKDDKKTVAKINKMPKHSIPQTVGWIAKLLLNGCTITEDSMKYFQKNLCEIDAYQFPETVKVAKETSNSVKSYENRHLIALDSVIDDILRGKKSAFDATSFLKASEVSVVDLKIIKDYYSGCAEQLSDKENKEYFKHPKTVINALITFYTDVSNSIDIMLNNKQREKAPRKVKPVSVEKILSLIKIQKESKELKITSMKPERILVSDTLLLYNTKYKYLFLLFSKEGKFTVNRTVITNIDSTKSLVRTLRKPEVNIHKFTSGTKAGVIVNYNELTTSTKPVESLYTNDSTIIVRAF